jgi:cellulase (glycosyl hydrolase family 5)
MSQACVRAALALGAVIAVALSLPGIAAASRSQWSMVEDHGYLVRSGPDAREVTLNEIKALGADAIRIEVKWSEVAPNPAANSQPSFDATDPGAYPGFEPYDDLVKRATAKGFRIMVTLAPDAPDWATAGGRGGNYKVDSRDFADFARAVGTRYSGAYSGLPKVTWWSIWNEPNHIFFIKPRSQAPRVYRRMVQRGLPALKAAVPGARVLVGELAPVGTATKVIGPQRFLQQWLCVDKKYKRLRGRTARAAGCNGFKRVAANGFAHHPYGPAGKVFAGRDIVNMVGIRRLATALDKSARAGRISRGLGIYNTEFGYQTNPPDPFIGTTPSRQAEILNSLEEFSYRYARLKSYSQYLLYDDPARTGPAALRWAGFQTGLRFNGGAVKPSYDAYRLPISVKRKGSGARIWGRVRPGIGTRYVQIQRVSGGERTDDGALVSTNSSGYFTVNRSSKTATYGFTAYSDAAASQLIGSSRAAKPLK